MQQRRSFMTLWHDRNFKSDATRSAQALSPNFFRPRAHLKVSKTNNKCSNINGTPSQEVGMCLSYLPLQDPSPSWRAKTAIELVQVALLVPLLLAGENHTSCNGMHIRHSFALNPAWFLHQMQNWADSYNNSVPDFDSKVISSLWSHGLALQTLLAFWY